MNPIIDDTTEEKHLSDVFPLAVKAVKTGEVETLNKLLAEHPDLANARSVQNRTLLHHLCDYPGHYPRCVESGEALVAAGADVNARAIDRERGEFTLQWAASNDDSPLVNFLIDAGAPVDGLNQDLRPLAQALWYGFPKVAQTLVDRGARLNLEFAAGLGLIELLASYFSKDGSLLPGAGTHTPPINGAVPCLDSMDELIEQALTYAVCAGSIRGVEFLLEHGADINAQPTGFDGQCTPLHRAVAKNNSALVELLSNRGADTSVKDFTYSSTPFGWAEHLKMDTMVRLLELLKA